MKATGSRMPAETQLFVVSCEIHEYQTSPKYWFGIKRREVACSLYFFFAFLLLEHDTQSPKCINSALYDW
jgi:hypothetical protein